MKTWILEYLDDLNMLIDRFSWLITLVKDNNAKEDLMGLTQYLCNHKLYLQRICKEELL